MQEIRHTHFHTCSPLLLCYWTAFILLALHFSAPLHSPTLLSFRLNKCSLAEKQALHPDAVSLSRSLIFHYMSCAPSDSAPPSPPSHWPLPLPPSHHRLCLRSAAAPLPFPIQRHSFIPLPYRKVESSSSFLLNTLLSFRGWPLLNHSTILITLLSLLSKNLWGRSRTIDEGATWAKRDPIMVVAPLQSLYLLSLQ